jgi:hypothetical protein
VSRTEEFLSLRPGDVVSFIGGGGKTTLIHALAARLAKEGRRVIVTATRPFAFRPGDSPPLLTDGSGPGAFTASPGPLPGGLLAGVLPEDLPGPFRDADYLLVEAEDARGESLPPPAAARPVPPATTVLCAVAGLDALGPTLASRGFAGRLYAPGGTLRCREELDRRFLLLSKADGRSAREDGASVLRALLDLAGPGARLPKLLLTSVRDFLRPVSE